MSWSLSSRSLSSLVVNSPCFLSSCIHSSSIFGTDAKAVSFISLFGSVFGANAASVVFGAELGKAAMATMSALKDAKEALDAGLVSQAEFDHLKRKYLRAKEEAFEFQKRESEAKLRAFALESIVKHGSSIMSEEQKVGLVRDYVKMSGLDPATTEKAGPSSKRQRLSGEEGNASPPQPSTPPPALAALPPPAPTPAAPDQAPTTAPTARRTPATGTKRRSRVKIDKGIVRYNEEGFERYLTQCDKEITEDWLDAALPLIKKRPKEVNAKIKRLFEEAARRGCVRIFADHATGVFQGLLDKCFCTYAADGGHLDVLKWLRSQDPPCPWSEATCAEAASNGQLDVVKWLRSQNPPCPWNEWTTYFAAENGHFDVLKWLHSQNPPCPWNERTTYFAEDNDHFDVLKWLVENGCPYTPKLAADRLEELGLA